MKKFKFISIFVAVIATVLIAINFASCQKNGLENDIVGKWAYSRNDMTTVITFNAGGTGTFEYSSYYDGYEPTIQSFTYKMKNSEEGEITITHEIDDYYYGEHYTYVETYLFKIRGNQLDLYYPADYYYEERLMATYTRL